MSGTSYPLNYEQFGNRDSPFFGDYNYVSASASNVLMAWPSGQDVIAGTDPRYTDGNGTDGSTCSSAARSRTGCGAPTPAPKPAGSTRTSTGSSAPRR